MLKGYINPQDTGIFQINKRWHLEQSIKDGFDIYKPKDNIRYAVQLYKNEGSQPWDWSRHCWKVIHK